MYFSDITLCHVLNFQVPSSPPSICFVGRKWWHSICQRLIQIAFADQLDLQQSALHTSTQYGWVGVERKHRGVWAAHLSQNGPAQTPVSVLQKTFSFLSRQFKYVQLVVLCMTHLSMYVFIYSIYLCIMYMCFASK